MARLLAALVLASALGGCGAKTTLEVPDPVDAGPPPLPPPDAGQDAGPDAFVPDPDAGCVEVRHELIEPQVDVLFVIDDSGSMVEEQEALRAAFRSMAEALATGDIDGDGTPEFPAAADLHVGVVTTDLGAFSAIEEGDGLAPVACGASPPRGDDARLARGCGLPDPWVSFSEGDSIDRFAERFTCLAQVGTTGCGFEQPLEAALKALTPATSEARFAGVSVGHGDGANAGFLRPDSVLAIVVLTDEDDGSVANNRFTEAVTEEQAVLGDAWLHRVERYVDGFEALRDDPERLVFAAIAGVPGDLAAAPGELDPDAVLADPRMQRIYDEDRGTRLVPSCGTVRLGSATPPRRLVELAGRLGDRAVVRSICEAEYRTALGVISERVGVAIRRTYCAD